MQKKFKKLLVLALMTPTLVMAQALPSAQSQAQPQAQPQAAAKIAPVTISPEKKEAIKALLQAIDANKLADAIGANAMMQVKQIVPAVLSEALVENKTMSNAQKQASVPVLQKNAIPKLVNSAGKVFATEKFKKDAIEEQYQAYARFYTLDEIKQLTAFYNSPTGRKFIEVQDKVGGSVVNSLMDKYMPQAIKSIREEADRAVSTVKVPAAK